jgi:hypothetical protein
MELEGRQEDYKGNPKTEEILHAEARRRGGQRVIVYWRVSCLEFMRLQWSRPVDLAAYGLYNLMNGWINMAEVADNRYTTQIVAYSTNPVL